MAPISANWKSTLRLAIELLDYTVVDDFGKVINPLLLEGQVHGGIGQGLGQALLESCAYDPETGQLLSASLMDYTLPRADNVPNIRFLRREFPAQQILLASREPEKPGRSAPHLRL